MALKISSKRLDKLTGQQGHPSPPTTPKPVERPAKPVERPALPDPAIAQAAKAAEASARAADVIRGTLQELRETILINTAQRREETSRRSVRMVVVRDREGLIEHIDVVDQPGLH
jgi:hypothetical protein